jgi:hypothetical protein
VRKSFIKFDLRHYSTNTEIKSAYIVFKGDISFYGGHNFGQQRSENSWSLLKLSDNLDFSTLAWDNLPKYSEVKILNASTDFSEDYKIDVSSWVQDYIKNPSENKGIGLKINNELETYRAIHFGSGDTPNRDLRPELIIELR